MIEIKMDEAGYEVYYSLDDAVRAFTHNIALENATLDLDIGLLLESDVDPFSNYGMEAIGEKVKEMASKAKSNFVLYAKKLINLLFGWLIKFFSGVVNIKKTMSKNYGKAKKYLEALNKYETQARQSSEKTVEITNAGNITVFGLTMVQIVKNSVIQLTDYMKDVGQLNSIEAMDNFTGETTNMAAVVAQLPVNDPGKLEGVLKTYQYNISDMVNKLGSNNYVEERIDANNDKVQRLRRGKVTDKEVAENTKKTVNAINSNTKYLENIKAYMSEPERREIKCPEAFDYLRTQLKLFIAIAKANKWDFENDVKKAENVRRKLFKLVDGFDVSKENEQSINRTLAAIVESGNGLSKLQNTVSAAVKVVDKSMNMMMTDVTKLGSILTTIGGGPAKDKDAED